MVAVLMELFLVLAIGCGLALIAGLAELIVSARRPWLGRKK